MFLAFSYAPFVIGMSKVQKYEHYDKDNNKTVAEKIKFMFTIDHRYIDGAVCAKLLFDVSYFIKAYFVFFSQNIFYILYLFFNRYYFSSYYFI